MINKSSHIWHPMTQHGIYPEMIKIDRAEGAYLYRDDGTKILDAISSWWVNPYGHCHPKIVNAVQQQAAKLEQVIFAGFTHEPAEKLSEKILQMAEQSLGPGLAYSFFSDSGSTAIEVAFKMAIGFFEQTNDPRHKVVALEGGYHGDTFGTMSAGERGVFNQMYAPFLFDVHHIPFPEGEGQNTIKAYQQFLEQHGNDTIALVLEPLVQGAAGMRVYSPAVLKQLYELSHDYGVLLIADEVMTAFGRTGTLFACEQARVVPDLICLSKGLTGGFLPMGLTLCTSEIYDAFYDTQKARQFFHSTSFSGNPLACAAAYASLEIWEEGDIQKDIARLTALHQKAAAQFETLDQVEHVRTHGTILALDIKDETEGYLSNLGTELYSFFLERDILLRPIGNCVYILPPYCITNEELERVYDCVSEAIHTIAMGRLGNEGSQCAA